MRLEICIVAACVAGTFLGGCYGKTYGAAKTSVLPPPELAQVAAISDQRLTGVAVSHEGRLFVNFPRWDNPISLSVAEVLPDGALRAFPDEEWNRWEPSLNPREHLICVQSVFVDKDNALWILDPASPNMAGVVKDGPKLVRVDIKTGKIMQQINFDETIAPEKSYLNDVRVDTARRVAYISESGLGAIIVVDLASGTSRRLLASDPSTKSENIPVKVQGVTLRMPDGSLPQVHCDGIGLSPSADYLYYHALTARALYRIKTSALLNESLSAAQLAEEVVKVGDTGPVDGMIMSEAGTLYLTDLEGEMITYRQANGELGILVKDPLLSWPDSMSILPGQVPYLYVTTSQIHKMPKFNGGKQMTEGPYRVFKVKILQ